MEELKQLLQRFDAQQSQTVGTVLNAIGFVLKGMNSDLQNQRQQFAAQLEPLVAKLSETKQSQ
jgi:hypothetical protein